MSVRLLHGGYASLLALISTSLLVIVLNGCAEPLFLAGEGRVYLIYYMINPPHRNRMHAAVKLSWSVLIGELSKIRVLRILRF